LLHIFLKDSDVARQFDDPGINRGAKRASYENQASEIDQPYRKL